MREWHTCTLDSSPEGQCESSVAQAETQVMSSVPSPTVCGDEGGSDLQGDNVVNFTSRQNFFLHCMCLFSVFDNVSSACDLLRVNAHASDLYLVDQRRRSFIYSSYSITLYARL